MKKHMYLVKFRDGKKLYVIEKTLARAKFLAKACLFFVYKSEKMPQIRSTRRLALKEECGTRVSRWDTTIATIGVEGRNWTNAHDHILYENNLVVRIPRRLQ